MQSKTIAEGRRAGGRSRWGAMSLVSGVAALLIAATVATPASADEIGTGYGRTDCSNGAAARFTTLPLCPQQPWEKTFKRVTDGLLSGGTSEIANNMLRENCAPGQVSHIAARFSTAPTCTVREPTDGEKLGARLGMAAGGLGFSVPAVPLGEGVEGAESFVGSLPLDAETVATRTAALSASGIKAGAQAVPGSGAAGGAGAPADAPQEGQGQGAGVDQSQGASNQPESVWGQQGWNDQGEWVDQPQTSGY
ncbi:hypothetical protein [Microbacterium paraoxydans]|uniref:hypothetical protein n=1 Tax=Microbacterium paraoxydans TaxID=199592 RepID=UPI003D7662FB